MVGVVRGLRDYRDVLQRDPAALALYEEEQGIPDCQHMGRILDPDPPAVRDIMELELLAGG